MQDICSKLSRTAAVVVILLAACVGSAWAQNAGIPWQVNDVVACVAPDTCYVLRIHSDNSIQFLDSLSDGLTGGISGVGFNNTLHLLTTNDAGGNASKVVEYSIASVNPFDGTIPTSVHAPIGTFSPSGKNAKAIAINNFGHIFVGNAGSGAQQPSIVELNAAGSPVANSVFTFLSSGDCATTPNTLSSLDLSADGSVIYVTAGDGVIRKITLGGTSPNFTLNGASCGGKFADFGPGVHLSGIRDIPAHALPLTCGSSVTTSTSCGTDETILVVATGTIDPDTNESENTETNDAVDICTNAVDTVTASCALLLNVNGTGLTADRWIASNHYSSGTILDPFLHIRTVFTSGISGTDEPSWTSSGGTVRDNAVVWSDQGSMPWQKTHLYQKDDLAVDNGGHVQKVTVGGLSGSTQPSFSDMPAAGNSSIYEHAVTWTNEGPPSLWGANQGSVQQNEFILDSNNPQHVQQATNAGTSGETEPLGCTTLSCGGDTGEWSNTGGTTNDGTVVWIDRGPIGWQPTHAYNQYDAVFDGTNIEQVLQAGDAGTSADTSPSILATWNAAQGQTTLDGLKWFDLGGWQANHRYAVGDPPIGDPTQHLQKVCAPPTANCPSGGGGGISGDTQPNSPRNPWNDSGGLTIDGLQWSDQTTPAPAIVARYPVIGTNTLQSLALDPLVRDCTLGACASGIPLANYRKTSNFWMADSVNPTLYKLDFTTGTITPPAGFNISTCSFGNTNPCSNVSSITGLGIYASESASQPGLASVVSNLALSSAPFTASATILQNTITSTLYSNVTNTPPTPANISLYASIVDQSSCFNDPSVGSIPCTITVPNTSNAVVWKFDIPLGGSTNVPSTALPTSETLNTAFVAPSTTNSTDVFVDEQFDDTTFVGSDPGTRTVSVHSLHDVGGVSVGVSGCKFSSPLPNTCYKLNRTTLNFTFSCPGVSISVFDSLKPVLSLVKKTTGQAPQFIPLANSNGTNGKATFRLDAAHNIYTFQLNLSGFTAGTYLGTAFDLSNQVQSFTTQNFTLSSTCK